MSPPPGSARPATAPVPQSPRRARGGLWRRLDWRIWPLYPKIGLAITALLLATVTGLTVVSIQREQSTYRSELMLQAQATLGAVAVSVQDALYFLNTEELVKNSERLVEAGLVERVRIYDPSGRVLVATDDPEALHRLTVDPAGSAIAELAETAFEWTDSGLVVKRSFRDGERSLGGMSLSLSTAALDRKIAALTLQGIVVGLIAIVLGVLVSVVLTRAITRPIDDLVAATERLASGDLDDTLEIPIGHGEVAILGTALDEMRTELARLYHGLEDEVRDRTRQLEEANRALHDLNRELEAKNAELERFTYTVSHDLKSPLITIRSFADLLERAQAVGDRDQAASHLGRISGAADTMSRLLTELLELSRIGRLVNPPEEVELGEVVDQAVGLVQGQLQASGAKLVVAPALPRVWVDRIRLVEVFENLLSNAIAALEEQSEPRIEIGQRTDNGTRVFFVSDNGRGIDPANQERVFGLFDKLDPDSAGTGIGLAIVKRIVEVHHGEIWVESAGRGRGAAFCFTLPEAPRDA